MFDRATFYATLRSDPLFDHGLSQRQVLGMEAVLDAWANSGLSDERWLAYILATDYHETGRAMSPVREGCLGKGHPYGIAAANGQVYYGRGFVQLTWLANYEKADAALGLAGTLVAVADRALELTIAAQILVRGMTEAWFTPFKLSDYLNTSNADYLHCRKIVNAMDKAALIAGYALTFLEAITAGVRKASDHTVTVPAKSVVPVPVAPVPAAPEGADDPLSQIADTIGQALDLPGAVPGAAIPAGGASPVVLVPTSATLESSIMEEVLPVLEGLFSGVAGKIGVASTVATAAPALVEGTIKNISEAPKAIADINALVADIQGGKWGNAPADVHALLTEFGVILTNYGISLPGLTAMINLLPAQPAIKAA